MPISSWQRVLREVAIREVGLVSIYSHEQSGGILQDIYYSPVHIQWMHALHKQIKAFKKKKKFAHQEPVDFLNCVGLKWEYETRTQILQALPCKINGICNIHSQFNANYRFIKDSIFKTA